MNITIKLNNSSKNKLKELKISLIHIAMKKFKNKVHAARWMGVSIRSLRNWIRTCEELSRYKVKKKKVGNAKWDLYPDE